MGGRKTLAIAVNALKTQRIVLIRQNWLCRTPSNTPSTRATAALHRLSLPATSQLAAAVHAMPLRPFAPSDNDGARPDAIAALSTLLKGDAAPTADVDAFLDSYLAHRSQQESDALRPLDERVLTVLARNNMKSAPRLVGCARVFRERSPALCEAVIREAPCIDQLAALAPTLARHLDADAVSTLTFLAACDRRIAGALVEGDDAPLLTKAVESGFDDLVEVLAKARMPDVDDDADAPAVQPPPPPRPREEDLMARVESGVRAVKSILGDAYGEGYLAACLAALDLNPERVIEALLDDNPPQAVSHLSPQLAKISTVQGDKRRTGDVDSKEAKRRQKARLRALERREQEDQQLREAVYDDDFDDRYDGLQEPTILTGDQDAVRRANALVRADEEEEAYWASQRNSNSTKSAAPAPAKPRELTAKEIALRRRRKTKNKGAQHHQKDRAARKV
jgi:hypothetical protein